MSAVLAVTSLKVAVLPDVEAVLLTSCWAPYLRQRWAQISIRLGTA